MIPMWLAFAVLLLLALGLLLWPLRRAAGVHAAQREFEANDRTAEQNVAIYRRRLESLEAAHARGEIDATRLEQDRLELDRSLLEDTVGEARAPLKPPLSGRLAVPVVAVALAAASLLWYHSQGSAGDMALYAAQQESESPGQLVQRLEEEATRQPDNPNVWATLLAYYRQAGQDEQSLEALDQLIRLEGRDPSLLAQKAQLLFFMAGRSMTDEVESLVDEVLAQDSSQPTALGVLGMDAFDGGDYEQAIDHWRRAVAGVNDPDSATALRDAIRAAQERLGIEPDAQEPVAASAGVHVRVSLDDRLQGQLDDDTLVYVVARDMEGELPPLAVARLTLGDLPATLVLDDSHAMSDQASISQANEVRLMARVSTTGDANPSPGDMFGDRGGVTVGDIEGEAVDVVIDRVVE